MLRGTSLVYAPVHHTRLHCTADIGAARRGLNVLASARSGAMFPLFPPPPFTCRGSLWAFGNGTLPFLACIPILTISGAVVKGKFRAASRQEPSRSPGPRARDFTPGPILEDTLA